MQKRNDLIFLTNDDGFHAKGLKNLIKNTKSCTNSFLIAAPEKNQSGKSHSITINRFIRVKKVKKNFFIVNGSPVDCVILGIKELLPPDKKPKLLISGINIGANMGLDLHYSGTLAAAKEAAINEIPAIAFSIQKDRNPINWSGPNYFIPKIINLFLDNTFKKGTFVNINFPNLPIAEISGIKIVKLGKRKPGLILQKKKIKNVSYIKIPSERPIHKSANEGEDEYELNKGYITISFQSANLTEENIKNLKLFKQLKRKIFE